MEDSTEFADFVPQSTTGVACHHGTYREGENSNRSEVMPVIYIQLDYEAYKSFEEQTKDFNETVHTTTGGFYHKSLRLRLGKDTMLEFHGPLVEAAEREQGDG